MEKKKWKNQVTELYRNVILNCVFLEGSGDILMAAHSNLLKKNLFHVFIHPFWTSVALIGFLFHNAVQIFVLTFFLRMFQYFSILAPCNKEMFLT